MKSNKAFLSSIFLLYFIDYAYGYRYLEKI